MLPKNKRISRSLFKSILKSNLESKKRLNSNHLSLCVVPFSKVGVAVSVSKKVSKKAVVRNKVRRRLYSALTHTISDLPNSLFLIIAKPNSDKINGEELKRELIRLIRS